MTDEPLELRARRESLREEVEAKTIVPPSAEVLADHIEPFRVPEPEAAAVRAEERLWA